MNEAATYAQAIIQFLSNMDVKASEHNVQQIFAIHAAVEKIKALSSSAPIMPREIPTEDKSE